MFMAQGTFGGAILAGSAVLEDIEIGVADAAPSPNPPEMEEEMVATSPIASVFAFFRGSSVLAELEIDSGTTPGARRPSIPLSFIISAKTESESGRDSLGLLVSSSFGGRYSSKELSQ
jgi:hypothetical protein